MSKYQPAPRRQLEFRQAPVKNPVEAMMTARSTVLARAISELSRSAHMVEESERKVREAEERYGKYMALSQAVLHEGKQPLVWEQKEEVTPEIKLDRSVIKSQSPYIDAISADAPEAVPAYYAPTMTVGRQAPDSAQAARVAAAQQMVAMSQPSDRPALVLEGMER